MKAEHFWGLRERFEAGQIGARRRAHHRAALRDPLPAHPVVIESKDELRRRGVKSPDRADSVMLACAAERSGPLESARMYARRIGEWRRDVAESKAQGKSPPPWPFDGKALMDSYQRTGAGVPCSINERLMVPWFESPPAKQSSL